MNKLLLLAFSFVSCCASQESKISAEQQADYDARAKVVKQLYQKVGYQKAKVSIQELLKAGAVYGNLSENEDGLLHEFADPAVSSQGKKEMYEMAASALAYGADPNKCTQTADTPLMIACSVDRNQPNYAIIDVLVSYGAKIDVTNRYDYSLKDLARKDAKLVRQLKEYEQKTLHKDEQKAAPKKKKKKKIREESMY